MIKIKNSYLVCLTTFLISGASYADGFSEKEVYSYKSNTGTPVFTDKRPVKNNQYETQTIEASNPTPSSQNNNSYTIINNTRTVLTNHNQTTVYTNKKSKRSKKTNKGKASLKSCQRYKDKFDYYSEKLRKGYRNSEYKKLEKNRKKYRNLLFNRCETKTFKE